MTINVVLRPEWVENVGYRYDVLLDGEVIVRRSRDPEHDVARVLHGRGFRGRFRTLDFTTGQPRMILDIEKAARLCTIERNDSGPIVVPYRPMSEGDKTRARLQRIRQERARMLRAVASTGEPVKHRGGERGVTQRGAPLATNDEMTLVPAAGNFEDA